jgi:AcrR family transcriptional regulator
VAERAKPKRTYNSARRREQALATRRTILDAAQRLFERDAYVATTMEAIAVEAGVALKTVYSAFVTKSGLLRALWDLLLKGDVDDAPVAARTPFIEVLDAADPRQQLVLNARNSRAAKERIGAMFGVIRGAASTDADCAALWDLIQSDFHANQRVIVDSLAAKRSLRRGLDAAHAADLLWTLNHPDVWLLLVGQRGWTADEFETWLAETSCELLLRPNAPARPARSARRGGR